MKFTKALVLVLLLLAPLLAYAQEDGDVLDSEDPDVSATAEELERELRGGSVSEDQEDIFDEAAVGPHNTKLTYLFPEAPFLNIESGKFTEVLVGVSNNAEATVIVRTVEASFRYPQDMSQILQNFTVYKYDVTIGPHEQATISYKFPIGPVFQPLDLGLTVLLTFETPDNLYFQLAAFNGTVNLVDPVTTFDFQAIFLYLFGIGAIGAGIYAIYNAFFSKRFNTRSKRTGASSSSSSSKAPKTETGTTTKETVDMAWIPDHLKTKQSPTVKARQR